MDHESLAYFLLNNVNFMLSLSPFIYITTVDRLFSCVTRLLQNSYRYIVCYGFDVKWNNVSLLN